MLPVRKRKNSQTNKRRFYKSAESDAFKADTYFTQVENAHGSAQSHFRNFKRILFIYILPQCLKKLFS